MDRRGLIGSPAQSVVLGWGDGDGRILVFTGQMIGNPNIYSRRQATAFLVFGGTTWDTESSTTIPVSYIRAALNRFPDTPRLWQSKNISVDLQDYAAEVAQVTPTICAGRLLASDLNVSFALRAVDLADLKLNRLLPESASTYYVGEPGTAVGVALAAQLGVLGQPHGRPRCLVGP